LTAGAEYVRRVGEGSGGLEVRVLRQQRRGRVIVGLGLTGALLLAACGGGGSSKSSDTTAPAGGDAATGTTTTTTGGNGGNGQCFTDPGPQKARVRFVNLFSNSTYPSGDIEVHQGFSGTDPCGKKLAVVKYGASSDYVDVTAGDSSGNWEAAAYPAGVPTDEDHQIISQSETWKGAEQVTMVFFNQDPSSGNKPSAGSDQAFFENDSENHSFDAVAGKALIAIGAQSLQYTVKDGAWNAGIVGQSKCLSAVGDTETTHTNVGGTTQLPFLVAPGSVSLGLWKSEPGTCTGAPDIGPVAIDAVAGSRTFVFAYGPDATHLKLLVIPVAS
jgi:hypothetical protein